MNETEDFYIDLIECFQTSLINSGVDIDITLAHQISADVAEHVQSTFGGCSLYIPKSTVKKSILTNAKIISEFNGINHEALAIKYNFTLSNIYRVIREHHAKRIKG